MMWVRIDDQFPEHPKVLALSDAALACWLRGLCYASRQMTDGALPRAVLGRLGKPKAAAELVASGLWDDTPDGWQIHDYAHYQRTRADLDAIAAEKGRAATLGNHKRWHTARGIVAPDCKWCRTSIAEPSQVRSVRESHPNRKRSPETETETETERATKELTPVATETDPVDNPRGTEDVVTLAVEAWAENELREAERQGDEIRHRAAWLTAKRKQADRDRLRRWVAEYDARPIDYAAALANPAHLQYLTRRPTEEQTA